MNIFVIWQFEEHECTKGVDFQLDSFERRGEEGSKQQVYSEASVVRVYVWRYVSVHRFRAARTACQLYVSPMANMTSVLSWADAVTQRALQVALVLSVCSPLNGGNGLCSPRLVRSAHPLGNQ